MVSHFSVEILLSSFLVNGNLGTTNLISGWILWIPESHRHQGNNGPGLQGQSVSEICDNDIRSNVSAQRNLSTISQKTNKSLWLALMDQCRYV